MSSRDNRREVLLQFFSGYFHEDWVCEADHYRPIVASYVSDVGVEKVSELRNAIIEYVNNVPGEVLEDKLYRDLGCCLAPEAYGMTAREWMLDVVRLLEQRPEAERP